MSTRDGGDRPEWTAERYVGVAGSQAAEAVEIAGAQAQVAALRDH